MTIQEVIGKLLEEKQNSLPARFHCRAIMVRSIEQYSYLIDELKKLGDISVFPIDELFSAFDVMPNYDKLTEKEYQDKWIILPGVSEYLRLFHASEETAQRFGSLWHYQWDSSTKGRILIPLWGCETLWYDNALGLCGDERQKGFVFDCIDTGEPQRMNIQVLSGDFEEYITELQTSHGYASIGLKEWYGFWYEPNVETLDHLILTKRYKSIRPTDGDIKIHVVRDTLSFIRENLVGGQVLSEDNCPKEAQKTLFPFALKGDTVDQAVLSALNAQVFRPLDMMGKWLTISKGQKQLVFLWYALHPDDSYLDYCVGRSREIDDLPERILTSIFSVRSSHPEWVADSQALISAVAIEKNDKYFDLLDEIPSLEERLDYLSSRSSRERIYILRLVGQWLKADHDAVIQNQKLKDIYPELYAYLYNGYPNESLKHYFLNYKIYKLSNTLPVDEESYFAGFDTDHYDNRYSVLCEEMAEGETIVLWIDALGAEWLPLLAWALDSIGEGSVSSVKVTQALLPSETKYNDLWKQMDVPSEKYDKLDKLAHKGVVDDKDYYACIEDQISFVCSIVKTVNQFLKKYARVLITGDHGTSRLAARFFHKREAMPLPVHAETGSHGRFCKVEDSVQPMMAIQKSARDSDGNHYLVFSNYDHYAKSGFAAGGNDDVAIYGEIHGGASPEEMLVPVITVNNRHGIPLTAKWGMPGNSVKISNKSIKCHVQFSKPVAVVQATIGDLKGECTSTTNPSKEWTVTFSGIKINKPKQFTVSLVADGTLVPIDRVEVKPALGGDDPF